MVTGERTALVKRKSSEKDRKRRKSNEKINFNIWLWDLKGWFSQIIKEQDKEQEKLHFY